MFFLLLVSRNYIGGEVFSTSNSVGLYVCSWNSGLFELSNYLETVDVLAIFIIKVIILKNTKDCRESLLQKKVITYQL